jgi:hypothetical protein
MTFICLRSDDVVGEAFSVMQGSVVGWRGCQLGARAGLKVSSPTRVRVRVKYAGVGLGLKEGLGLGLG